MTKSRHFLTTLAIIIHLTGCGESMKAPDNTLTCPEVPACPSVEAPVCQDGFDLMYNGSFLDGTTRLMAEVRVIKNDGRTPRLFMQFFKQKNGVWTRIYDSELTQERQ